MLSEEHIALGHLPLFSVVRRVVFLSNLSSHTISFHWTLASEEAAEVRSEVQSFFSAWVAGENLHFDQLTHNSWNDKIKCTCIHLCPCNI